MVSVVSGNGLGLVNTSRGGVGAAGEWGQAVQGRAGERVTVNAANGNLVIQNQDGQLIGVGADVGLLRTYNSQGGWDGDNGDAWRLGYYRRISGLTGPLNTAGSTLLRTDADGFEPTYTYRDGRYVSTDGEGAYDTLVVNGATATWTDGDSGLTEMYADAGAGSYRLVQITDSEGHALRLTYDGHGLITGLSTWKAGAASADESLSLVYDDNRRLTQVDSLTRAADGSLATQTRTRYRYDTAGRLARVVTDLSPEDRDTADGQVYTVDYGYDDAGRLRTLTQTDGSAITIDYDERGRVCQLTDALGQVTRLRYDTASGQTTVTDALNQSTVLTYDGAGRLTGLRGATSSLSLTYDANGNVLTRTNGLGQQTVFAYDERGNLIRSTDAAGHVLERSHDPANRLIRETQYIQLDPDGASGPGTASGALVTRYVYDTTGGLRRLRFTLSAEGRVTEQQYNSLGQISSSLRYGSGAYTGVATLADLSAWASQQAAAQRQDYLYDLRGQLASRSDGAGTTRFVYDPFGRLLQTIDAVGNTTANAYDGLDRVTLSTNASGSTTLYSHDDAGNRNSVTLASRDGKNPGLRTVSTYNAAGLLIALAQFSGSMALGETRYFYDAAQRLRMTQDPTGQRQWKLYDEAGCPLGDVDALGHLTEFTYDAAGRRVLTTGYDTAVNVAALVDAQGLPIHASLVDIRPAALASDRRQWQVYDAAGRAIAQVNGLGEFIHTQYDGAGRVTAVIQRGQRLAALPAPGILAALDAALLTDLVPSSEADRITRHFYDGDGLLRATLDPEGGLTEMRYDAAGRLVERVAYATVTPSAQRATGTLARLTSAASPGDRRSLWWYDSQGRLQAELDAEGYLTEHTYNAVGQRTQSLRYARGVTGTAAATSTPVSLRPASSAEDHSLRWTYDALGRVQTETAADGTVTQYGYDRVGNLIRTDRALGTAEVRGFSVRYDAQGRVTAELSAVGAALLTGTQTQEQVDAIWAAYATQHDYDAAGRRIRSVDALGRRTTYYYDAAGRQVYRILQTERGGEVQASRYTGFGEVASSTGYIRRLSVTDNAALTGGLADATLDQKIAALADQGDARTQARYNQRGLIQQAIDALGHQIDYRYDAFGQLRSTEADANAVARLRTDYVYDRRGLLTATTQDPLGLTLCTSTEYDAFGRVTASVDARGNRTRTQYVRNDGNPDSGRQVVLTDATGASRTTFYDAFDRVIRQTDALGLSLRFSHDTAQRRVTLTTAEGIQTVTEHTRHGQIARLTDGTGATTTYRYDANGNLLSRTDALGNTTTQTYDAVNNLRTHATPGNAVTLTSYDAANRVLSRTVDPSGLNLRTLYEYDGLGRAVKITDPGGTITRYAFDAQGGLKDVVIDDGAGGLKLKTTYTRDAQGRTLSVTEGAGTAAAQTTEYRYDVLGRRTQEVVDPAGLQLITAYEYDAAGNVVLRRDAVGGVTRWVFDALGRQVYRIDALGNTTRSDYDAEGRLVQTTRHATAVVLAGWPAALTVTQVQARVVSAPGQDQVERHRHDADGRLRFSVDALGAVTEMRYDAAGRVTQTVRYARTLSADSAVVLGDADSLAPQMKNLVDPARDRQTRSVYDAAGRQKLSVNALGVVTETRYDAAGRVVQLTQYARTLPVDGPASVWADSPAQLALRVQSLGDVARDRVLRYGYDAAGRQTLSVDALGAVSETRYDAVGRVVQVAQYARALTVEGLTSVWTDSPAQRAQRVQGLRDAARDRVTRYVYDGAGRQTLSVDALGTVTQTRYDAVGRVTQTTQYANTLPAGGAVRVWHRAGTNSSAARRLGDFKAGDVVTATVRFNAAANTSGRLFLGDTGGENPYDNAVYSPVVMGNDGWQTLQVTVTLTHDDALSVYVYGDRDGVDTDDSHSVLYDNVQVSSVQRGVVLKDEFDSSDSLASWTISGLSQQVQTAPAEADSAAQLVQRVQSLGDATRDRVTRYVYDAAGRQTLSVDAVEAVVQTRYDAAGRVTQRTQYANTLPTDGALQVWRRAGTNSSAARRLGDFKTGDVVTATVRFKTQATTSGRLFLGDPAGADPYDNAVYSPVVMGNDGWQTLQVTVTLTHDDALSVYVYGDRDGPHADDSHSVLYDDLKVTSVQRGVVLKEAFDSPDSLTSWIVSGLAESTRSDAQILAQLPGLADPGRDRVTRTVYDAAGHAIQQIDAEGYLTTHSHDAFGNVVATQRYASRVQRQTALQPGDRVSVLQVGSEAPSTGAYLMEAPGLTARTVFEFTQLNQSRRSVNAEGAVESTTYNAFGDADTRTNTLGGLATFDYDRLGRLVQEALPVQSRGADGSLVAVVNRYDYDSRGNRIQAIEALGLAEQRVTQYRFDANNRLVMTVGAAYTAIEASGASARVVPVDVNRYDTLGLLVEQVRHANLVDDAVVGGMRSLAWYDAAGRKTAELAADGVLARFRLDGIGNLVEQTLYATRVTTWPAQADGPPPSVAVSADDRTLRHSYDALGRKVQTQLAGVWSWENGQPVTLAGAQTLTLEQLRYDAAGNVIQHIDARGNASFSYYDGLGRKRLAIDTGGYATAWDYALPGGTATQETRYARRVPLAAYDGSTDPQAVRNALAALGADPNERDRVTVFLLDRLGRMLEKQVQQVAFGSVNDTGSTSAGIASAITAYRYDGLGHVTQIRERIGTDLWQATDIDYDLLGREIKRQAPGYVDHQNQAVRPTSQIEYDGLGRARRFIQRGKDNSTEADDRITLYTYGANGVLSELRDAAGAITRNSYDALGNLSRQTRVAVLRADGSGRDLVKTWQYDAAGRVTVETDLGTGEARQSAYTAFGEVRAKGLNGGWQEFAEYNTRGLVWKTNAGDGAVKIYLQDQNGNTTREIRAGVSSATNLRGLTLAQASINASLLHSISVYDARNLRIKTMEQRIERQGSEITLGQQFTEKWLPSPGDLNVNPTPGGSFPQAAVGAQVGYSTVTVSEGAQSALPHNVPVVSGGVDLGAAPVLGGPLRHGAVMSFGSFEVKSGIIRSSSPTQVQTALTLPASPAVGTYFVTQTRPGQAAILIGSNLAPGARVSVGYGDAGTYKLDIEWQAPASSIKVAVAQIQFSKWIETEQQVRGAEFSVLETLQPRNRIVLDPRDWKSVQGQEPTRFVAVVDADKPGQSFTAAPAMAPWAAGIFWPASSRLVSFDLTSPLRPPLSDGEHTLTIMAFDASGAIVSGRNYKMTGGKNPTLDDARATVLQTGSEGTMWSQNIRNASNTLAGRQLAWDSDPTAGYRFRWRRVDSQAGWQTQVCYGPLMSDGPGTGWPGADGKYECAIESIVDGSVRIGHYDVEGGLIKVADQKLDKVSFTPEILSVAGPRSPDGRVRLMVNFEVFEAATDAAGVARFDLAQVRQRLGYDRWKVTSFNYTAEAYVLHPGGLRERMQADNGVVRLGPRFDTGATGSVSVSSYGTAPGAEIYYRPISTLTLMNAKGSLTLRTLLADGSFGSPTTLPLDGSDWRLRKTRNEQGLDELHIDLSLLVPADNANDREGYGQVEFFYQGDDGQTAAGLLAVDFFGQTFIVEMYEDTHPLPLLPLRVPGAATLSVFKVGPDPDHLQQVPATQVTGTGPEFNWSAAGHIGQTLCYAFEAVDSAGRVVGKGSGMVTVAANGQITHRPNPPALMPAVLRLTPPPGTAGLVLEVRPAGSTAAFTALAPQATSDATRVYNVDAWLPSQGTRELEFRFVATAPDGAVLSVGSGRLRIDASGSTSGGILDEHRPVYVHFRISGRQVAQASLALPKRPEVLPMFLQGTWVPPEQSEDGRGYTRFTWDAAAYGGSGTQLEYSLSALAADGQALPDEIGRPLVQKGRVVLHPDESEPVRLEILEWVPNTSKDIVITRYQAHNAFGEVIEERDERVAERMKTMLGLTRDLTAEEESRARTTLRYNTLGQLITKIDPETHITLANGYRYRDRPITAYGYDLLGRSTTSTDANGNLTRQALLPGSNAVATEWHADGGVHRTAYDVFGDARQIIDEGNNVIQQTYDPLGRLIQVNRLGVTQVNSAGLAQPAITLTDSFTYDALGQRLSHTNALGNTTRMDYDSLGRVVSTRTALGLETRYQYQTELVTGLNGSSATGLRKTSFQADGRSTVDRVDYFGHTTSHSDLSGAIYTYNYDAAARLVSQSSSVHTDQSVGQNIRYTYYANGYIKSATDESTGTLSEYGYDSAGNRVTEGYFHWNGSLADAAYQNATLTYDELNRVVRIYDSSYFDIRYEYDAVGNRRLVESVYWDGVAGLRDRQTYWYAYDVMNRFTVTKGALSGNRATDRADTRVTVVAGAEGTTLGYDTLGRRRVAEYKYDNQTVTEVYGYRQDGFLQTTSQGGILKTVRVLDKAGRTVEQTDRQNNSTTVNQYDADNRLLSQVYTDGKDGNKSNQTTYTYYNDKTDVTGTAGGAGALAATVTTQQGTTVTTAYKYDYWDDAQQKAITKTGATTGTTTLTYNANGHLTSAYDQAARLTTRYFNSAHGLILKRERQQGSSRVGSHYYYYADGKRVGDVSDDPNDDTRMSYAEALARKPLEPQDKRTLYTTFKPVTSADFDQNYEPINDSYPGPTGSSYTAQGGESLPAVAQALWGDGSLWYLIAEANGLSGTQALVEGQVLVIPNKVTNIHNNSSTVRPYNAGEAIGSIDPTLPAPPPPPGKDDCGAMKMVLVIVVAVAVTVVTGGAAAGVLGPVLGSYIGTMGVAVVGGSIGGAVGSIASQGVALATGMQDHFSWTKVGQSTLSGAVTAGVTAGIDGSQSLSYLRGNSTWASAGRAVVSSSAEQALHGQWNWQEVLASALGASAGTLTSQALAGSAMGRALGSTGSRMATGLAGGLTARWAAPGSKASYDSAFASTLGNVLGDDIVDAYDLRYSGPDSNRVPPVTSVPVDEGRGPETNALASALSGEWGDGPGLPEPETPLLPQKEKGSTAEGVDNAVAGVGVPMGDLDSADHGFSVFPVGRAGSYGDLLTPIPENSLGFRVGQSFSEPSLAGRAADATGQGDASTHATGEARRGALSERYETGGRGSGTVSGGAGDPGGVSYGSYQLASERGRPLDFLEQDGAAWAPRFTGMDPTVRNGDFGQTWQQIARESPEDFFNAQHDFIQRTHYDVSVARIQRHLNLDINAQPVAVQDVVWSTAVQHGPNNSIVETAYRAIPNADPASQDFSEQLINAIYDERSRTRVDGTLVHFSRASTNVQAGVARRFVNERADALHMLRGQ